MNSRQTSILLIFVVAIAAALAASATAVAEDICCLNNFRFSGGCRVVVRGQETCRDVLSYLNSFQSVGKYYCDNTTIRGGWTLAQCSDASQLPQQNIPVEPSLVQPNQPVQQRQPNVQTTDPGISSGAQDASLLQVSAPLDVRFTSGIDSDAQPAGQIVTGVLESDLMSGDTVIAPAGSEVQFRIVPTSYWTDGGGDSFEIQATAIRVGEELVPINATAVNATSKIDTSGEQISVPGGSLVSFETEAIEQQPADIEAVEAGATAWMEAFHAKDIEAMTAYYAEDAVLLPPNAPAVFGRDAVLASVKEMFASGLGIELEDLEIKVENDLGYKAGRYRVIAEDGSLVDRGKYIEIWTKEGDTWVLHRDIWNSSVQPEVEKEH
jgi:ketosteroid isomerase-like protein